MPRLVGSEMCIRDCNFDSLLCAAKHITHPALSFLFVTYILTRVPSCSSLSTYSIGSVISSSISSHVPCVLVKHVVEGIIIAGGGCPSNSAAVLRTLTQLEPLALKTNHLI